MRCILIILFSIVITSCKTANPPKEPLTGWLGSSGQAVIQQLGQPAVILNQAEGRATYVYSIKTNQRYPSPDVPQIGVNTAGKPVIVTMADQRMLNVTVSRCNMHFELENNRVVSAYASGMDCFLFKKK